MRHLALSGRTVAVVEAWTRAEIAAGIRTLLDAFVLPADRGAAIVLKPNLNNDLLALSGNSTDLRVLAAICEALADRGYGNLTIADGSNVGIARRGIDVFQRLRVDRLAARHGARLVDLNQDQAVEHGGLPVARTVLEADFLVSVPTVKTHAEMVLSCAMKNWVGIVRGQDKRLVHRALAKNIVVLNERVRPHLVITDGIVGMEGNGPGDGEPFRLGRLVAAESAVLNDLAVARMIGIDWASVPYLREAFSSGAFDLDTATAIRALPIVRAVRRAPDRPRVAVVADRLSRLKLAARPLTDRPAILSVAQRLGVVQDVYDSVDDRVVALRRNATDCGDCRRCEDACPDALPLDRIGAADCIGCLYCWWVCPRSAIDLEGELGFLERHAERYKAAIEQL
jgi:uncharacterized protein (DUF362 family)/ferredoxin